MSITQPTVPTSRTESEQQKLNTLTKEQLSVYLRLEDYLVEKYGRSDEVPDDWQLVLDPQCLLRFCRARKFNYDDVLSLVTEWLNWRITRKPHLIKSKDVQNELKVGKIFWFGHDKEGCPNVIIKAQLHVVADRDYDEFISLVLYTAESLMNSIKSSGKNIERYNIIYDASNIGYKNFDANICKDVFKLSNYYAERLNSVYIINANWILKALMKVVKPMMDPVTFSKIVALDSIEDLKTNIDKDQLIEEYGGSNIYKYTIPCELSLSEQTKSE
ncbi:CRAL-TRIO domain-containing protein [Acrasis kona]|uniref:CRAL-TRIO domain-containing protein n=1 Tax=Acrasis kona TaxID=1008807 RepID=A0AAW2ZBC4_9EUKA